MSILVALMLAASPMDQVFDEASGLYDAGRYTESVMKYEELVFRGVQEPEVFFNLGNAYYRSGYLSPAIVNYERALQLKPTLNVAHDNLVQTVSQTERGLGRPQPPGWEQAMLFWHFNLERRTVATGSLVFWSLTWAFLIARRLKKLPYMRRGASLCVIIALASGASWWVKAHPLPLAVAAGDGIPVHYGKTVEETVRFELFEGDRVVVEESADGWLRVRTPDDERGWVQAQYLINVGPPYASPTVRLSGYPDSEKLDGMSGDSQARRANDDHDDTGV